MSNQEAIIEAATKEFGTYNFGLNVTIESASAWEVSAGGKMCRRDVRAVIGGKTTGRAAPLSFVVRLDEDGEVVDAYAVSANGELFGHDPHRPGMFQTVLRVLVLSEQQPVSTLDLEEIGREMNAGDLCGSAEVTEVKRLNRSQMTAALLAVGNDGSFFGEDGAGREVDPGGADLHAAGDGPLAGTNLDFKGVRELLAGLGTYGKGVLDAAESMALALIESGVAESTIESALDALTDAVGNNVVT